MRQKGSVTVFFSLVFMVLFSFILSFFEFAAYTARASYHASAALLATENYFAAFLEPLFDQYHIFGREVPVGEDILSWTEGKIGEDVSYMTVKQEGEKSLLLRSGAKFAVTDTQVLTDQRLEGFHSQAVTAMKYRGVLEVAEILTNFSGMTEQATAHMEFAAAKATTDSAYAKVDEKILHLIELVDGVEIKKYEKFMNGKATIFQKGAYVKYFCTNPAGAAAYFDRTEVYRAFLSNHENPYETLKELSECVETLADEMEEREEKERKCRNRLAEVRGWIEFYEPKISELGRNLVSAYAERLSLATSLGKLVLQEGTEEEQKVLGAQMGALDSAISSMGAQKTAYEEQVRILKKEERQLEKEQKELEKEKKEQEKQAKALMKEEKRFVRQCETVCGICTETYSYVDVIKEELERAKKVKSTCETVLDSLSFVIGEEAEQEYRKELEKYQFYEDMDGFDFERMQQTLFANKSVLGKIKQQIQGISVAELRAAAGGLRSEQSAVANYSFDGLKLNYGEMSLAENIYEGVEDSISSKVASGILSFFTEESVSEKKIDTSYLPSGFRYDEDGFDIFSLLGTDMSGIFEELKILLPQDMSLGTAVNSMTDAVLFHAYLTTHFGDFLEKNEAGALSYEQEYLIVGKDTDQENLSSVTMRICAIRTILHFISLYTDSARKAPAEQAALAACGVIGLPALKSVVVFLLLFVWALEEAVIDTASFLQGKRLLLYPGKNGGSLSFQEVLLFSKSFVMEKAHQKTDAKGVAFGYNEYLHVFLFLTSKDDKKYRAADLIQENLRKTYHTAFRMNRCVWKISYSVDRREYMYAYE